MDKKEINIINPIFLSLSDEKKRDLLANVSRQTGLNEIAVEKDIWITAILRCIFSLPYAQSVQFKGGTSLSKCWSVIERLSEDIDLAIEREFLGYPGELSKSQVSNRLRRASKEFIVGPFLEDLKATIVRGGIPVDILDISTNDNGIPTQDPVQVYIRYHSLYEQDDYLLPQVMLEISGRSNRLAVEKRRINSILDTTIPDKGKALPKFEVMAIQPKRTFIEKVCLLHEEFNKSHGAIRSARMSRHLYDLYKMCGRGIDKIVLSEEALFKDIIRHRFIYNRIDGVDYNTETPGHFAIIPPGESLKQWEQDYRNTIAKMIYGDERPDFDSIIARIRKLNEDLNAMRWNEIPVFNPGK